MLTLSSNQLAAGMSMRAQSTYMDGTPRTIYFSVPLTAADFIRPREFTVAEFGSFWEVCYTAGLVISPCLEAASGTQTAYSAIVRCFHGGSLILPF